MPSRPSIFDRVRLRPSQVRAVAERRFMDSRALIDTRKLIHTNGAMYLAGFVVECLLKARLLEKHAWLQHTPSAEVLPPDRRRLWSLCYQSHELGQIAACLPEVLLDLQRAEPAGSRRLSQMFATVCNTWTIYARYSPRLATMDEAVEFIDRIKELKPWLR
jgi:hypothetical protein